MTTSPQPSAAAGPQYRLVQYGGGFETIDRLEVRNRIRSGDITDATELSLAGTDEWKPAYAFPELERYFALAATGAGVQRLPGQYAVPAKTREVVPLSNRIVHGLLYPVAGGEVLMLIGLSVLASIPIIGILASLVSPMIMISIIRSSANGRTKMPMVDTSEPWELIRHYFAVLFVTLVALIPVIPVVGWGVMALFLGKAAVAVVVAALLAALAFAALYYPACLVTVACWDSVLDALNPVYIATVIRRIGSDYFAVVGMWFVAMAAAVLVKIPAISPFAGLPIFGSVLGNAVHYWALFYVSHLLGYAVYRHLPELGWE